MTSFGLDGTIGEREDLESPGIGNERSISIGEFVQTASITNDFSPRMQQEMVGVGEDQG